MMNSVATDTQSLPARYQAVISLALSQNIPEFYTDGGCGVLAALMAEATIASGECGTINLILREPKQGRLSLSHISFRPDNENLDLDIYGDNAQEQWAESLFGEADAGGDDADLILHNQNIPVAPGDHPQAMLEEITKEHELNVGLDWVRDNYPKLREMLFQTLPPVSPASRQHNDSIQSD